MSAERFSMVSREEDNSRFAFSFLPGLLFVMLLWLISLLSYLAEVNLSWLGIFPRNFFGLIGVVTGPLIHADMIHLLSNTFPFLLLSGFILFQHRKKGVDVLWFVYVLSGVLTWFIGRQAYHVGASGVIYGMASYLLFVGFTGRDRGSFAVSLAILFLYSGLFYGMIPGEERVSWEGHIAGFMAGFIAALTFGGKAATEEIKEVAEEMGHLTPQQRYTSHTLGNNNATFYMQYSLQEKAAPVTFNYSIAPARKAPTPQTMPLHSSSMEPDPFVRSNAPGTPNQKQ